MITLYYSPFFTGECYRDLPVNETRFESVVGDAALLDFLELHLGLPGTVPDPIERILAYQSALDAAKEDAFYKNAFKNDPLATAKEILRWRDLLVMEGFDADTEYKAPRLRKLAEVERVFRKSAPAGMPERWKRVREHVKGTLPDTDIVVCHDFRLLPRLIRETLEAIGVKEGRYDGMDPVWNPEGKDIIIRYFGTEAEAYCWAADNFKDYDGAVICPHPFRMNAVLRNRELPLLEASANGDSSITQLLRLGLSLLVRPMDINNLLEFLRTGFSPIPGEHRYALARALKRDGGRGETWNEALAKCEDDEKLQTFLLPLLNANADSGTVPASVITDWCEALAEWSPTVITEERKAYQFELIALCNGMCRIIRNMGSGNVAVKDVLKALKTFYEMTPVKSDKAMARSWNAVDSHRCLIDVPDKLLWLPCNGGIETVYPYSFLLQEEIDELKVAKMSDFVRYDFNLMLDRLGGVKSIELCACDFDCAEALAEHPAVTLCKPTAKEEDHHASGDSTPTIFEPLRTIETGVDLYPRRESEKDEEERKKDTKLSPTSIESLIGYPFDFVMKYKLHFQDISDLQLSNLTLSQGTVAHYVFQNMLENGDGTIQSMRAMLEETAFEKRVDEAAKERGAILLLKENRTIFIHFKETIRKSIGVLLDILEKSGLTSMKSEEPLDDSLGAFDITGSVDFHAETESHQIVVIDFKYSGGKTYIEKLDEDKAIQLEVYAEALKKRSNKPVAAKAYYFFPINQLHTDDESGIFKGSGIIRHKKKENETTLSKRIWNSVTVRRDQLKSGVLEMEEGAPLDEIDYHKLVEKNCELKGEGLIDIPSEGPKDNKVKFFYSPTKYPILKDSIK